MEIRCMQEPITKIAAMFRNLLISSFEATIRVKRAFHPALASQGFASHVFGLTTLYLSGRNVNLFQVSSECVR